MFIKFLCFACGHKLKASPALAGKRARCTRCSQTVVVPRPHVTGSIIVTPVPLLKGGAANNVFCV